MARKLNLLLVSVLLSAQTPPPEVTTHENQPTFTTRSNLVLVRVVVRDKKGLPNGTLQKEDFQIFDKGKPQFISKFAVERSGGYKAEAAAAAAQKSIGVETAPPILPDHYIAYVFDDLHLSIGDLGQAQVAAERQLTDALGATGRAAIATTSGQTMLDFTDDVPKLRDSLLKIRSHTVTGSDCPDINYYMADLIQNRKDANAAQAAVQDTIACAHLDTQTGQGIAADMVDFAVKRILGTGDRDTRIALRTLRDAVRRISGMPGRRSAVMIPGGDASQGSASIASINVRTQYKQANAAAEGQVLGELAEGTGGTWIHNNDDLAGGLKQIAAAPEVYYVLGFSPET